MIKNIRIDGFRHFKDLTINFNYPYTLLCGLNGTGKTAVIEILSRLQQFIINCISVDSLCSLSDIPEWDIRESGFYESSFQIELENDSVAYSYSLLIKTNFKNSQARIEKENLFVNDQLIFESCQGETTLTSDDDRILNYPTDHSLTGLTLAERNSSKVGNFLVAMTTRVFALSINPHNINSSHQKGDAESQLSVDASNFSAWYDFILDFDPAIVVQTFSEMRNFIPGFKQFVFRSNGISKELMVDISTDKKYQLPFNSLSHGQKILSILHLLVRVAPPNSTIAIDELENFLAPTEIQPLFDAFQDAYEEKDIQFILISHHPKTLRWYTDSAIILSLAGEPPRLTANNFDADKEETSLIDFLHESTIANEL